MRLSWAVAAVAMLAVAGARAAPPSPVVAALAMLKSGGTGLAAGWRYEEKISTARGSERLSYDPARTVGERWQVLAVNGKTPSEAARKRLAAQAARASATANSAIAVGSGWLATSDYRLVKTTAKTLVYQLRPQPASGDESGAAKLLRHLAGQFVVARDDHHPLALSLDNFESFSPRFGVRIEAFAFRAEFRRLGNSGPVVVVHTSNSARGKVFWIKQFEDKTEVTLSGFAPVTASAAGPVPERSPHAQTASAVNRS
ncbi:MAG: hypothetical protein ACRER1_02850 [Gammaproteobacteria bacterium]